MKLADLKQGDKYCAITDKGVGCFLYNEKEDKKFVSTNQVFKTREEAEAHLKVKQAELKIIKWIAQNDNVVLDWDNEKPNKWTVYYSHEDKELRKNNNVFSQYLPKQFYLSSRELAQRLIDELGTELKIWLGVEE